MPDSKEICAIVPAGQQSYQPLVYGMGFLVNDKDILTCAHVIEAVLGIDWLKGSGSVQVCFPFSETAQGALVLQGQVDRKRWYPKGTPMKAKPTDIAVIVLEEVAPASVKRATLLDPSFESNVTVKIYGFAGKTTPEGRIVSQPTGLHVEGKIMGELPGGRAQFQGLWTVGTYVQRGYSGAGVYDPQRDSIVGMVVRASTDEDERIAEFIGAPSLRQALGPAAATTGALSIQLTHAIPRWLYHQIVGKKMEIETYLKTIADILPEPDLDRGLSGLLDTILSNNPGPARLRLAFGFGTEDLRGIFNLMKSGSPAVQSLWGKWAQRIDQSLWRFTSTLAYVSEPWAKTSYQRALELQTVCGPYLPAKQPTLKDIEAVLDHGSRSMSAFIEYTPDAELYAVMRAFRSPDEQPEPPKTDVVGKPESKSAPALNFILNYLDAIEKGTKQIDDSSNAWWAVRLGICRNDHRFSERLALVAEKFAEPRVPQELAANNPMPEIYKPVSTISYTLSNAQAILECNRGIAEDIRNRLHEVIARMRERLLATPVSRNLYLASVHQEGLRNYLDYLSDQGIAIAP